jgi:hypothetical protein
LEFDNYRIVESLGGGENIGINQISNAIYRLIHRKSVWETPTLAVLPDGSLATALAQHLFSTFMSVVAETSRAKHAGHAWTKAIGGTECDPTNWRTQHSRVAQGSLAAWQLHQPRLDLDERVPRPTFLHESAMLGALPERRFAWT